MCLVLFSRKNPFYITYVSASTSIEVGAATVHVSLLMLHDNFTDLAIMRLYKILVEWLDNSNARANRGPARHIVVATALENSQDPNDDSKRPSMATPSLARRGRKTLVPQCA